jgi:hypothetical protein
MEFQTRTLPLSFRQWVSTWMFHYGQTNEFSPLYFYMFNYLYSTWGGLGAGSNGFQLQTPPEHHLSSLWNINLTFSQWRRRILIALAFAVGLWIKYNKELYGRKCPFRFLHERSASFLLSEKWVWVHIKCFQASGWSEIHGQLDGSNGRV